MKEGSIVWALWIKKNDCLQLTTIQISDSCRLVADEQVGRVG